MPDYTLPTWIARHIRVRQRLQWVCACYVFFLMVVTTKHSLEEAARFSGLHKSQFSKLLKLHRPIAVQTLENLSKQQAKRLSQSLKAFKGLPWKMAIIIDSTLQSRSSLRPENAKRFNHGQGFVIGHQWTNIVLIIHDILMPLRPIPFYSKRYCLDHGLVYLTEHALVVDYLTNLNLGDYIGSSYDSRDVLVLTDSGYDNKKIENAIVDKHWTFITALRKTRSVKSETLYLNTPKSKQWSHVATFFRNHRRLKRQTIRIMTDGKKTKRMEFRIRHTIGYLRYVGQVQLVCSEPKKRLDGLCRYFACNDVRVKARQIIIAYRPRWAVELFHKKIKQHLGFGDVATSGFDSVMAHVHWVYCAYILFEMAPPGVSSQAKSLGDKQRQLQIYLENKDKRRIRQKLTQIGGFSATKKNYVRLWQMTNTL